MMLRNLIDQISRRRQWPLVAIAALVLVAVPLLLLGSSSDDEPTADLAAPAAPAAGKLPARAQRLLDATEVAASAGGATGSSRDPFAPPSSYRAALAKAAATGNGTAAAKSSGSGSSSGSASVSPPKQTPIVIENPTTGAQQPGNSSATTPSKALTISDAVVDIRFGKIRDTPIKRAIPRLKTFFIHGKLAAVFVKYSPSRKKAVFAVAPNVVVTGVKCRNQDGVCRYVDLAPGDHAWLTMVTASKTIVNRRLDVVHIKRGSTSRSTTAKAASAGDENACLLRKLQSAKLWDVVERDACER